MIQSAEQSLNDNISITQDVVNMAQACDVCVESELGLVPRMGENDDAVDEAGMMYTTAGEAKAYVRMTEVNCLAVSIGTARGRTRGKPRLEWPRLKQINEAVGIPLVIHGGSSLTDDQVRRLVTLGVAKINYYTALSDVALDCYNGAKTKTSLSDYTDLSRRIEKSIARHAEHFLRRGGAAGRAAEVLAQCAAWSPIEHEILLAGGAADAESRAAQFNELREQLQQWPGVREVLIGRACTENSQYRYSLRVRFCSAKALLEFQNQAEALNKRLRKLGGDRVCLEFETCNPMCLPEQSSAESSPIDQLDSASMSINHGTENRVRGGIIGRNGIRYD
jgi:fructose-bisphosphate aldolase class II